MSVLLGAGPDRFGHDPTSSTKQAVFTFYGIIQFPVNLKLPQNFK